MDYLELFALEPYEIICFWGCKVLILPKFALIIPKFRLNLISFSQKVLLGDELHPQLIRHWLFGTFSTRKIPDYSVFFCFFFSQKLIIWLFLKFSTKFLCPF